MVIPSVVVGNGLDAGLAAPDHVVAAARMGDTPVALVGMNHLDVLGVVAVVAAEVARVAEGVAAGAEVSRGETALVGIDQVSQPVHVSVEGGSRVAHRIASQAARQPTTHIGVLNLLARNVHHVAGLLVGMGPAKRDDQIVP